jgi:nicotinamide riboside kinase
MPKIAISGSHSTGKSTVMDALKQIPDIANRFTFKGEVLRSLKKQGIKINELGTDDTQLLVVSKFLEYYTLQDTILDRCALDGLVYTAYLYEKGQVKKSTLKIAEAVFENLKYDIYFYIAPEFDIVHDGIRSDNTEFRTRIAELFEEYMESYKIVPVRLSGTVENRVSQFIETVAAYDKWQKMETKERNEYIKNLSIPSEI